MAAQLEVKTHAYPSYRQCAHCALFGTIKHLCSGPSHSQQDNFIVPNMLLSAILFLSVLGSLIFAGVILCVQIAIEARNHAKLRRIKYVNNNERVVCKLLSDPQAFHLFLSHAWPTAQDRMRIVKARFQEALPSCRVFLECVARSSPADVCAALTVRL